MEIVKLLSVPPESKEVKTLYEVFSWGREALAEYLFFAEIDSSGLKEDGSGDLLKAKYWADVEVSFESDTLAVAKDTILCSSSYPLMPNIESIGIVSPHELFQSQLGAGDFLISSGSDYCYIMRAVSWSKTVLFIKVSVENDRTTTIQVASTGSKIKLKYMHERANELIELYKSIPMHLFSGAIRE